MSLPDYNEATIDNQSKSNKYLDILRLLTHSFILTMVSIAQFLSILHGYAIGMIVYHRNNCTDGNRWNLFIESLTAMFDELFEVMDELRQCRWKSLFEELADLWHTCVVLVVRTFLPLKIQTWLWIWCIVFFWAGVKTPWKHGTRYLHHQCIRSEKHCKTKDHFCANNR